MQLNKVVKSLVLIVPLFTLVACPSTDNMNDGSENANNGGMDGNGGYMNDAQRRQAQLEELQRQNIVYFDFDKYDIRSDFADLLDAHAMFLRANPSYKVVIEGHADERGTPEYNIALGERRASAVQMYLQGKGVSAGQMAIVSYGKEKPAVLGHDEAAYSKNRRAVLVY
jgi:peptidoglycan-associated lipoprotein